MNKPKFHGRRRIKTCPFCDGFPILRVGPFVYVKCEPCGAEGPKEKQSGKQDEKKAIDRWNTRAEKVEMT